MPTRPIPPAAPWADPLFTIGVTGTNGKTSTTWMIAAALREAALSVLQISTVGVALDATPLPRGARFADFLGTLALAARSGCRHAVIETTSLALAQGYARTWRFDMGVFTNLSAEHFGTHGSWEHYLAAKAQLMMHLGPGRIAVLNAADPHAIILDQAVPADVERRWFAAPNRGPALRDTSLTAERFDLHPHGTRVWLAPSPVADALGGRLDIRMVGEVFGENALAAALAALAAGIPPHTVTRGLAACPVVPGRFEIVADAPAIVAVDYAHTPDALIHTCTTARRLAGAGNVLIVFGAGGGGTRDKRLSMGEAVGARADLVFVTSDNPRDEDPTIIADTLIEGLRTGARATWQAEPDRARAIHLALTAARPGDVVVIAGKGHESGQSIKGHTTPFSDAETVRQLLATRS